MKNCHLECAQWPHRVLGVLARSALLWDEHRARVGDGTGNVLDLGSCGWAETETALWACLCCQPCPSVHLQGHGAGVNGKNHTNSPLSPRVPAARVLLCGRNRAGGARSSLPLNIDSAALVISLAFVFILLLSYPNYVPSTNISLTEAASGENIDELHWEITLKIKQKGKI